MNCTHESSTYEFSLKLQWLGPAPSRCDLHCFSLSCFLIYLDALSIYWTFYPYIFLSTHSSIRSILAHTTSYLLLGRVKSKSPHDVGYLCQRYFGWDLSCVSCVNTLAGNMERKPDKNIQLDCGWHSLQIMLKNIREVWKGGCSLLKTIKQRKGANKEAKVARMERFRGNS